MPDTLKALVVAIVCVGLTGAVAWSSSTSVLSMFDRPVTMWTVGAAFALNWVAFVIAAWRRTERFYDLIGMVTFLATCAIAFATLFVNDAVTVARALPLALVAVWTTRLGTFLFMRVHEVGKDGRFDEMKAHPPRFFIAWTLQAVWVILTSFGAVLLATTTTRPPSLTAIEIAGFAMFIVGFTIEVVADAQKTRFRRDAEKKQPFIDEGLWRFSRHPNYFGEIVAWVGIAVAGSALLTGAQRLAWLSPVFVWLLVTKVSGIPLLEARARARFGDDPEWQAYVARTSRLVPWPRRASTDIS